jgi:predicted DNA-binding transcriptional regulator AlpA
MAYYIDKPRLTMRQTAQRVGVHVATIWRWHLAGVRGHKLPAIRIGGRRFVLVEDLEYFIQSTSENISAGKDDLANRATDAGRALDALGVSRRDAKVDPRPTNRPSQIGGKQPKH